MNTTARTLLIAGEIAQAIYISFDPAQSEEDIAIHATGLFDTGPILSITPISTRDAFAMGATGTTTIDSIDGLIF